MLHSSTAFLHIYTLHTCLLAASAHLRQLVPQRTVTLVRIPLRWVKQTPFFPLRGVHQGWRAVRKRVESCAEATITQSMHVQKVGWQYMYMQEVYQVGGTTYIGRWRRGLMPRKARRKNRLSTQIIRNVARPNSSDHAERKTAKMAVKKNLRLSLIHI